jgi:hypothetical protein
MIASVTAVAANRAVQLNRRPIHHSIAQHITTGTMSSGFMARDPVSAAMRRCRR